LEEGFLDYLGANSLDDVALVMAFEEAFDVEIPVEDAEGIRKLRSMQDVTDYIRKHRKGGN
jgi:acyl carrier protein